MYIIRIGYGYSVGKGLDDNWQRAFVVPTYVVERNPGLKTVQDLDEFKDLFVTQESNGKSRLASCIIGWKCPQINEAIVTGVLSKEK